MDKDKGKYYITVCTPTYNSAHLIHRVYEGLLSQDYKFFEWVIVDDGSTDNTKETVNSFIEDCKDFFPIHYYYQNNQHKKVALFNAIQYSKGSLFVICDADDKLLPNALNDFVEYWEPIYNLDNYICVLLRCIDENKNLVGKKFDFEYIDSNYIEMEYRFKLNTDFLECWRTSFLKIHFPNLSNVKGFVPESYWFLKFSLDNNKMRYVNKIGRIYYRNVNSSIKHTFYRNINNNLQGILLNYKEELDNAISYFFYSPINFIKSCISYNAFKLFLKTNLEDININNIISKILVFICFPLGFYRYFRIKRLMNKR